MYSKQHYVHFSHITTWVFCLTTASDMSHTNVERGGWKISTKSRYIVFLYLFLPLLLPTLFSLLPSPPLSPPPSPSPSHALSLSPKVSPFVCTITYLETFLGACSSHPRQVVRHSGHQQACKKQKKRFNAQLAHNFCERLGRAPAENTDGRTCWRKRSHADSVGNFVNSEKLEMQQGRGPYYGLVLKSSVAKAFSSVPDE